MSKYIIKNCPALYQITGITNECLGANYQCQDCTDCVMKQIVELCKYEYMSIEDIENMEQRANRDTVLCKTSRHNFAANILQMLDIQEVE